MSRLTDSDSAESLKKRKLNREMMSAAELSGLVAAEDDDPDSPWLRKPLGSEPVG